VRLLVTGGAGFIGSNFVHYVLNEHDDDEIITLDALTYAGSKNNLTAVLDDPRHTFVEGDICDRELVTDLVKNVDAVVNFAAESHVDQSIKGARPFVETNVAGTQSLLDAAEENGVDRFLQISTDEVYGEISDGEFVEDDPLNPRNPYAATKAGADLLAQSYGTTHDVPVLITRTCNNFGPRQHKEKLIPKFIELATAEKSLPVYGDGSNVREWIHVKDNCQAIDLVLRDGEIGDIYNIGTGKERTNLEVTHAILEEVGADKELIEFVDDRPGHDQRYALDSSKIQSLGWEPKYSFEQGLKTTVEHYS